MSGISITVDASDFADAFKALRPLFQFEADELMTSIGALGESQTRRRIADEKTAPDGTAWLPNAEGTSILMRTGQHLLATVSSTASNLQAEWGSSWPYAHVHQEGAVIVPVEAKMLAFMIAGRPVKAKKVTIPARPFIGLSSDNIDEIRDLVSDHFGALFS